MQKNAQQRETVRFVCVTIQQLRTIFNRLFFSWNCIRVIISVIKNAMCVLSDIFNLQQLMINIFFILKIL